MPSGSGKRKLRVSLEVAELIRHMHPQLKFNVDRIVAEGAADLDIQKSLRRP